ncbi:DMT family transporter [Desulfovibrio mangrovi]|uniref:DMT family transporter n=1 Tax=Desulfovibrio mangrovi TaxID=2976983 RepID=UPI0022458006|nr:DMT family transporter [Desulfovibrio mangrovi]UZP66216.1 DMT family transporter [Desulfovibrio mangrovi]
MMIYFRLLLTAFIWGGTFVAGRMLAGHAGPFAASFWRFAMASVCLLWLVRRKQGGLPKLDARGWFGVGLLGATGIFAYNAFFFTGLQTVPAGRAAVIVAMNPAFIALFAALFFKEGMSPLKLAGITLSFAGAAMAISRGDIPALFHSAVSWGDMAIFGCVASWVSYSLLGKRMMHSLSPLAAVTYSCLTGTLMLLPFAVAEGMIAATPDYPLTNWLSFAYLGVLGTVVGFTWFYEGVKAIGASKAGVFINFVPVTAILCGWLLLGEPVSLSLLAGGLMVVSGVYLTNRG